MSYWYEQDDHEYEPLDEYSDYDDEDGYGYDEWYPYEQDCNN